MAVVISIQSRTIQIWRSKHRLSEGKKVSTRHPLFTKKKVRRERIVGLPEDGCRETLDLHCGGVYRHLVVGFWRELCVERDNLWLRAPWVYFDPVLEFGPGEPLRM